MCIQNQQVDMSLPQSATKAHVVTLVLLVVCMHADRENTYLWVLLSGTLLVVWVYHPQAKLLHRMLVLCTVIAIQAQVKVLQIQVYMYIV